VAVEIANGVLWDAIDADANFGQHADLLCRIQAVLHKLADGGVEALAGLR
jgi:hypothetical protein